MGRGVIGVVDGKKVMLGGAPLMAEQGIDLGPLLAEAEALRQDGTTAVFAAVDGPLAGVFGIADPIKPTTPEAVRELLADGIRLVMMTGDNRTTALAVAKRLGIQDVEAEVLPQDKAAVVQKLRAEGRVTLTSMTLPARADLMSSSDPDDCLKSLTARQVEILTWVQEGKSAWEIGGILDISGRSVDGHLRRIYARLDVRTRLQAVLRAQDLGMLVRRPSVRSRG